MDLELGKKFIEERHFKKAFIFFLNELKKGNNTVNTYFFLGLVCFELNKIKDSINYYKVALKISPRSINIILNLANAYLVSGSFLSAKSLYLKVIKLNKLESRGYYGLYLVNPQYIKEYIQNLNDIKNNHIKNDFLVEYLLSKIAKLNNNQDLELQYLNRFQAKCFKSKYEHNQQGLFYYNKIISKHYNKINFENLESKEQNLSNISPIFIIGLPRSGSTLIETMISNAKHNVISLGETSIFNTEIINLIKDQIFKKNFNSDDESLNIDIKKLKQNVLHRYEDYFSKNEKNLFFVDKSLENFFNIEIILKIFPNAKFINCKRNYNDNAIAIYQSMLPDLPWTHTISDILAYIDSYIKILSFYEMKLQKNIFSIDLSNLTFDQKNYSKLIYKFCGLSGSSDILKFDKKKDMLIKTLSNNQVRKNIFSYDKNKYKIYDKLLNGFKDKYVWLN